MLVKSYLSPDPLNGGTVVHTDRGPRSEMIGKERDLASPGDLANAQVWSQGGPSSKAWVESWYGAALYWNNGKAVMSSMPDWNRYKY